MTTNLGVLEVSQKPNAEKDVHAGIFIMESTLDNAVDGKKQLEINTEEPASIIPLEKWENVILLIYSFMLHLTKTLFSTLPGNVQPGPDHYGLSWKPVFITAFLEIISSVIFFWRTIPFVKNHICQVTKQQLSELKILKKKKAQTLYKA